MCNVEKPPAHAINRGIAIEGFATIFSGALGASHGTSTYGGNIGAIGMTKVLFMVLNVHTLNLIDKLNS